MYNIMVIDDFENLSNLIVKLLELDGMTAYPFSNPAEAIGFYAMHHDEIDLVVTDYSLGYKDQLGDYVDGDSIAMTMRNIDRENHTKFLLLTGSMDTKTLKYVSNLEIFDVIIDKGIMSNLQGAIRELFNNTQKDNKDKVEEYAYV